MEGLVKLAAEYASREDDLIHRYDEASRKRNEVESTIPPSVRREMVGAQLKHALGGTGIGAIGGGLLGAALTRGEAGAALGGSMLGGVLGLSGGAISGAIKADNILQQDPDLHRAIQQAKADEFGALLALERHHELKNMYSSPQQVQLVQGNNRRY
jgi:outer membrane lipoprotein SlyB